MDPNGHIYISDEVPEPDAARLDGFLRGRAEGDAARKEEAEAAQAEVHKLLEQIAAFKPAQAEAGAEQA